MTTLDDLFRAYLSSVEPKKEAVDRAKEAHESLRKELESDSIYGPFIMGTMLSGSYGRDTSIFHIKDVDIIIKTNFTEQYLYQKKETDETVQECLIRLTQEAIKRTGRAASAKKARRSVHITLPEEVNDIGDITAPELTLDIVPVIIQTTGNQDPMTIADRGDEDTFCNWYNTYPNTQRDDSVTRNAQSYYIVDRFSYKPLVKIFKAWKRVHFSSYKAPKGFILECLAATHHNPKAEHWMDALHNLFQNLCTAWPYPDLLISVPEIHDISNSAVRTIPIAKTIEEVQRTLKKIHKHLELIEQAADEAETDLEKAATTLQRVLGQDKASVYFPLPSDFDGDDGSGGSTRKSSPFVSKSKSDIREAPPFGNKSGPA